MLQSNTKFYLRGTISHSLTVGGTFNISNDLELGLPIDTGGEIVSIVFKNDRQIERMTVTITQSVCTVVTRGIEQQGGIANVGLQKQWNEGVLGYITALDFDILDKNGDSNTISANNTFTGDNDFKKVTFNDITQAGLEVNSLTTTERLALTPVNGSVVYDETLGQLYMYIGGAWSSIDTGTATPNMSETVNGTGEIATAAQRATAQSVGETGARLVVSNDGLVKVPDANPANDENKIGVLNEDGKYDEFVTPVPDASTTVKGIGEFGTDEEFLTGTDTTRFPNLKQASFNVVAGDAILATSPTDVVVNNSTTSYTKFKEIQVGLAGTYRVTYQLLTSSNATVEFYTRIYVNGVAVGTERVESNTDRTVVYKNDYTVSAGDLIQLYAYVQSGRKGGTIQEFYVSYNTVSKLPTGTVNL